MRIGILAVALFAAVAAHAQPVDNGRILQDETGRYASAEAAIQQATAETGIPVKVYVASRTPNNTNVFSHNMARQWNIPADGLLFCIFDDSRQVAITAGANLESQGIDNKFLSQTVIPAHFKPGWRDDGPAGAVRASLVAVRDRLHPPPSAPPIGNVQLDQPPDQPGIADPANWFLPVLLLFAVVVVLAGLIHRTRSRIGTTRRTVHGSPDYGMDIVPVVIVADNTSYQSDPGPSFDSSPTMDMGGGFDAGGGFSDTGSGSY